MNKAKQKTPEEIIAASGNAFHCKVATAFRDAGWTVIISPYYVDSASDKAREFDLLCERTIGWKDSFQQQHTLCYQLFVECKYLNQPTVFWFDLRDQERTKLWLDSTPFKSDNVNHAKQHYMQAGAHVAKLFANGVQEEQEPMYKALTQCLGGMTQGNWNVTSSTAQRKSGASTFTVLQYPLIVVSDSVPLYRAEVINGSGPAIQLTTNFVLEVNYAYLDGHGRQRQEYFLVDVVNFARLGDFFSALETEVQAAQFFISTH